jgi:homoserine O-acetyltransferase
MNGSVGIVETKKVTFPEITLECGEKIAPVTVAHETYGELNERGDNAILILHALTGDAHVAGKHRPEDKVPGWWDPMVGPGRPFDTSKYFIVCSNVLGGCYGTTGPSSINPATGKPWGMSFPIITIRDMVNLQYMLVRHLGITKILAAVGGSMGGMQALEWAYMYPEMLKSVVAIATSARLSPFGIAFNAVGREAIMTDPEWRGGDYYGFEGPKRGLALARMIGIITYKSDISWQYRFGRTHTYETDQELFSHTSRFEIENYLYYQGDKLVKRFDANTYLYLLKAMDLHDISRGRGRYREILKELKTPLLAIGIDTDFLYPTYQQKEIVEALREAKKEAYYWELSSPHGHDAFLIEFSKMAPILSNFLEYVAGRRATINF